MPSGKERSVALARFCRRLSDTAMGCVALSPFTDRNIMFSSIYSVVTPSMDNVLEVCEGIDLEVEYLSLKERGAFAFPPKATIRAFNRSEDYPNTVTIVLGKSDIPIII